MKLEAFNAGKSAARRLPASAAVEAWLFGTHPMVSVGRQTLPITVSTLQEDFVMDRVLADRCGHTYRLLTGCFLHGSVFHILFNLGYLYTLAPYEAGAPGAFFTTFLLSCIGGNFAFLRYGAPRRALGASGGICGLIGYELVSRARLRQVRELRDVAKQAFGAIILGLLLPGVCNSAHLGGMATGVVVALLVSRRSGYRNALLPWPALLGGLLIWPTGRRFALAVAEALKLGVTSPGLLGTGLRLA